MTAEIIHLDDYRKKLAPLPPPLPDLSTLMFVPFIDVFAERDRYARQSFNSLCQRERFGLLKQPTEKMKARHIHPRRRRPQ